jgi:hypothetical protein
MIGALLTIVPSLCLMFNTDCLHASVLCATGDRYPLLLLQIMFVDLVDWESQDSFSTEFLFTDMWLAYKGSQKQLLDGIEHEKNVIIHTGMPFTCAHRTHILCIGTVCDHQQQ